MSNMVLDSFSMDLDLDMDLSLAMDWIGFKIVYGFGLGFGFMFVDGFKSESKTAQLYYQWHLMVTKDYAMCQNQEFYTFLSIFCSTFQTM